jgi:hypothetical protein
MLARGLVLGTTALLLCAGCATAPGESADVESYATKVYRTGSNIPVKDYGAENIEVAAPEIVNPANRPLKCVASGAMRPGC